MRWWTFPAAIADFAFTMAVAALLANLGPDALRWGWWRMLSGHGGSPLAGGGGDTPFKPLFFVMIPLVFVLVPILAWQEERVFRRGIATDGWPKRIWRCLAFGMVHCLMMGMPIFIGLAIAASAGLKAALYCRIVHRLDRSQEARTYALNREALYIAALGLQGRDLKGPLRQAMRERITDQVMGHIDDQAVNVLAALHSVYNWIVFAFAFALLIAPA